MPACSRKFARHRTKRGVAKAFATAEEQEDIMNVTVLDYMASPTCWLVITGAFLSTLVLTPLVIRIAHKMGVVRKGGYRRVHRNDMPLMGGLAILLPFIAITLLAATDVTGMFKTVGAESRLFIILAAGAAAMGVLGFADDVFKLRARYKFTGQIVVALAVALSGGAVSSIGVPFIGSISLQEWGLLGIMITVFWIVGVTNAVNLIDGMDGLATGVALIMSLALACVAGINGNSYVVIPCLALAGSLAAFLLFNWHPAKIFLGDTGSLFLGFSLATIALFGAHKTTGGALIMAAILAMGVPIFETFISMARRHVGGFSMFMADDRHTHHRLLKKGFSQRQVALIMYAVAFICLVAAVISSLPNANAALSFASFGIAAAPFAAILIVAGYVRSIVSKARKRPETQRRMALADYMSMRLQKGALNGTGQDFMALLCEEFRLSALSLCFQGEEPSGIMFQTSVSDAYDTGSRMGRIYLNPHNCNPVEIRYVHNHVPDDEESHAASVCLGSIFKRITRDQIVDPQAPHVTPAQAGESCIACEKRDCCKGFVLLTAKVCEGTQTKYPPLPQ